MENKEASTKKNFSTTNPEIAKAKSLSKLVSVITENNSDSVTQENVKEKEVADIKTSKKVLTVKNPVKRRTKGDLNGNHAKVVNENEVEVDTEKLVHKEEINSTDKEVKEKKKSLKKSGKIKKNNKKMIAEKKQVKKTAKKVDALKDKLKKVKKKDAKKSVIKKVKSELSDSKKTLKTKKAKLKKALKK